VSPLPGLTQLSGSASGLGAFIFANCTAVVPHPTADEFLLTDIDVEGSDCEKIDSK